MKSTGVLLVNFYRSALISKLSERPSYIPDCKCLMWANMDCSEICSIVNKVVTIETLRSEGVTSTGWVCCWFQCQVGTIVQIQLIYFQGTRARYGNPCTTIVGIFYRCEVKCLNRFLQMLRKQKFALTLIHVVSLGNGNEHDLSRLHSKTSSLGCKYNVLPHT